MTRIARVTVKRRVGLCAYWTVVENGVAVLATWRLDRLTLHGYATYERVA